MARWTDRLIGKTSEAVKRAYNTLKTGGRLVERIGRAIKESFQKNSGGFSGFIARIRKAFASTANDAKTIARTQATLSESLAKIEAGRAYQQETGKPVTKTWICTFHNSRDSHIELHGTTIPLEDDFHAAGGPMFYPGDDSRVGPEEICNCRCYLIINRGG